MWKIPCGIIREGTDPSVTSNVLPLSTVVDQNLSTSTIQERFLQKQFNKDELSKLKEQDQTNKTHAIPSGSLLLRMGSTKATVMAPKLEVVTKNDNNSDDIQLRLGQDFLSMYQGWLDIEGEGGLFIVLKQEDGSKGEEVLIPVMQARPRLDL
mmetsp:Transcript_16770/g.40878  ORF Transcript_16770/g.40878 Transcript_16770/m.40878 type:complete len:153 (+) Transcript_16770:93-551(+)